MAYFAVISDKPASLRVVRCHINIWALSESAGMTYLFDVGLGLRSNGEANVTKFRLALPFRHAEWEDLCEKLTVEKTAKLILGQPVEINDGVLTFKETRETKIIKLKPVSVSETAEPTLLAKAHDYEYEETNERRVLTKVVKLKTMAVPEPSLNLKMSTDEYSLWKFALESPIESEDSDAETYIRMRFRVKSFSRMWVKQGSSTVVDIRISDVREGLAANWKTLEKKIVDIESLNLFVIAPSTMKWRSASPELKYMRLLEGPVWEDYLDRMLGKNKQVIYYWRSEKPITRDKPFMAFLDLTTERSVTYMGLVIVNLLILAIAWGLYHFVPTKSAVTFLHEYWLGVLASITVTAIFRWLWSVRSKIKKIIQRLPRLVNDLLDSDKK